MACWQIPVMGPPDPEHTAKGDVSSNGLPDQVQASTSAREAYVDTRKGTIRTADTRSSHLYSEPERPQAPFPGPRLSVSPLQWARGSSSRVPVPRPSVSLLQSSITRS